MSNVLIPASTQVPFDNGDSWGSLNSTSTNLAQIFLYKDFSTESIGSSMSALPEFDTTTAVISDEQFYSGGKSAKHTITIGTDGFNNFGYGIPNNVTPVMQKGDELWFRQSLFFPAGWDMTTSTGRLKCFRFRMKHTDSTLDGYIDIQIKSDLSGLSAYIESHPNPAYDQWYEFPLSTIVLNQQQLWEVHVVFDDTPVDEGGTGRIDLWLDGVYVGSITAMPTMQLSTNYMEGIYMFTYWNGNAPATQSMYIDAIAYAVKKAGERDDSVHLAVDNDGRKYIGGAV